MQLSGANFVFGADGQEEMLSGFTALVFIASGGSGCSETLRPADSWTGGWQLVQGCLLHSTGQYLDTYCRYRNVSSHFYTVCDSTVVQILEMGAAATPRHPDILYI